MKNRLKKLCILMLTGIAIVVSTAQLEARRGFGAGFGFGFLGGAVAARAGYGYYPGGWYTTGYYPRFGYYPYGYYGYYPFGVYGTYGYPGSYFYW